MVINLIVDFFLIIGITNGTSEFGWISLGKSGYHLFFSATKTSWKRLVMDKIGNNWKSKQKLIEMIVSSWCGFFQLALRYIP